MNRDKENKITFQANRSQIFSNPYIIGIIFIITLGFIGYGVYYYLNKTDEYIIESNSSFYGKDLLTYESLFQNEASSIKDCIDQCKNDIICDGITYNKNSQICIGTKNGQVRNESSEYSAWVKPPTLSGDASELDFKKSVLVGFTNGPRIVKGDKIARPYMIGNFSFSFNISINDYYKNYGYWRHIFHKGTDIESGKELQYQSWENLIVDIPKQCIGVWIAPFNNNMRIAVLTTSLKNRNYGSYPDAFVQKCNNNNNNDNENSCYVTDLPSGKWVDRNAAGDGSNPNIKIDSYIEYFDQDLQNIPINKKLNIIINIRGRNVEIYFNGKIVKITQLDGIPQFDKTNLYVMQEKSINANISNLLYFPDALKLKQIKNIMEL